MTFLKALRFLALAFFVVESATAALAVDMRDTFAIVIGTAGAAENRARAARLSLYTRRHRRAR
jgi:hypothetical protein